MCSTYADWNGSDNMMGETEILLSYIDHLYNVSTIDNHIIYAQLEEVIVKARENGVNQYCNTWIYEHPKNDN